jgi:hypothetical protein
MTILKSKAMPVCVCREALKVWQNVLIYFLPIVIMFTPLYIFSIMSAGAGIYSTILVLLSFFWAFDLTLVIYVLRIRLTESLDYISVDHHVYIMTLFSRTYVRANKKRRKK